MSERAPLMRRISSLFLVIILVTLVMAIVALYQAVNAFRAEDLNTGINFAMIGATTLAFSAYLLFQSRRKMRRFTIRIQRVATTILCQKCDFKTIRDFQRGDYIFKETEECPKCNEKMLISSIYREAKEKES